MNVLVGPNNAGKSTIIGAFRVLNSAIRRARAKSPQPVEDGGTQRFGYPLGADDVPVSLENAHTDYGDVDSSVDFDLDNGDTFTLSFPSAGGCWMFVKSRTRAPHAPGDFRRRYPVQLGVVPVLGPVEHDEPLLHRDTVQSALTTHRASRHFRNYWYHNPDQFEAFQELIEKTWPEMQVRRPEVNQGPKGPLLVMFCRESRIDRELYWIGSGFQIWCQLLTHVIRSANADLLVVDEPEIYLHPDVQRQLLRVFRSAGPPLLLATHSSELAAEAEPTDILLINKRLKSAKRLKNAEALQEALDYLGSGHNIALAHLARTRRLLFVEGDDFRIIRRLADRAGFSELASGLDIVPVQVGGFGNWQRVTAAHWTFQNALDQPLLIGAVFDRDYYCDEEIEFVEGELRKSASLVVVHRRKEIENFLLLPAVLNRCVQRALAERAKRTGSAVTPAEVDVSPLLEKISDDMRADAESQFLGKAMDFFRRPGAIVNNATISKQAILRFSEGWATLESRLKLLSGKEVLSRLNRSIQNDFGISLTNGSIILNMRRDEMPSDLLEMLSALDRFRITAPPVEKTAGG